MKEENIKRIYKMHYDRDYNDDGSMRQNHYLGTFIVKRQGNEDAYCDEFIGLRQEDGKIYKVNGREKSGIGGGIRYSIEEFDVKGEIEKLQQLLV